MFESKVFKARRKSWKLFTLDNFRLYGNLTWLDPTFAQRRYRLQYKRHAYASSDKASARKSESAHRLLV